MAQQMKFSRVTGGPTCEPSLLACGNRFDFDSDLGAANDSGTSELSAKVEALFDMFLETYGFPGATAAFVLPDGSGETIAVGFADVETSAPMTVDSRMLAASIGKSIWGALVLSLEKDGVLSRTDLVSEYLGHLPWFARVPNAEVMTIEQLLTHTSGVPDHVHMNGVAEALMALAGETAFDPADVVAFVLDEPPPSIPVGVGHTATRVIFCWIWSSKR